jgi:hypothetical protein
MKGRSWDHPDEADGASSSLGRLTERTRGPASTATQPWISVQMRLQLCHAIHASCRASRGGCSGVSPVHPWGVRRKPDTWYRGRVLNRWRLPRRRRSPHRRVLQTRVLRCRALYFNPSVTLKRCVHHFRNCALLSPDGIIKMGDETLRRTLYVGNLPDDITTKELNDEFRKFGRIVR